MIGFIAGLFTGCVVVITLLVILAYRIWRKEIDL